MKRPFVGSLEHRPEGLDAVRVCLSFYVLGNRVANRLMVRQPYVASVIVSVDLRAMLDVLRDKALERELTSVLDDLSGYAVGLAVSFAPKTAVLPTAPRPAFSFLRACLFRSLPPKYVSSISTGPPNALRFGPLQASRIR